MLGLLIIGVSNSPSTIRDRSHRLRWIHGPVETLWNSAVFIAT